MKNDILMLHGVDPLPVQMIRNQLNPSRINAVHFLKQKSCRTVVRRPQQSISAQSSIETGGWRRLSLPLFERLLDARLLHIALTMFSVTFLASPSNIMVLSR
ncbi:hypothetical protein [Bradyrhizobium sp.]|uniref:hypothetical protein n=1 Tax=Bradyrhizobium sp. TaxID=376 RepID=UPI00260E7766|nr:hypothetical protein [Bradyrhizobium sp.]